MPAPSKIYAHSTPCILIGYTPHSKAYQLWEPSTSRVFNSFHVTFTEHLNAEPTSLLPGKTLGTERATIPPSWESPVLPFLLILPSQPIIPSHIHPILIYLRLPPNELKHSLL
jgi:hypothetical protein